jgi:hypothetical protein
MRKVVFLIALLAGCDGFTCGADADCESGYACRPDLEAERLDATTGCVDRCIEDEDCAAAGICLSDGTCG